MKKKIFYCSNLAYYAKSIGRTDPETMISMSETEGGTFGEFAIRWINMGNELVPQLQAYNDSWQALSEMPELITLLAGIDNKRCSQKEFNQMLLSLNYKDTTAYDLDGKDSDDLEKERLTNIKNDLLKEIDKIDKKLS